MLGLTPLVLAALVTGQPSAPAESRLHAAIGNSVAGEAVSCIGPRTIRSTEIVEGVGILFDTGNAVYLNRPTSGADAMNHRDGLRVELHFPRLCRSDVVELFNRSTQAPNGFIILGDFVPYRSAN